MHTENARRQRIAIGVLPNETGHLNPACALARRLIRDGFEVTFVGVADDREVLLSKGFDYLTIAEDIFPIGSMERMKKGLGLRRGGIGKILDGIKLNRTFDDFLASFADEIKGQFDLIIADGLMDDAFILVGKRAGIAVVQFHVTFPFHNPASPPLHTSLLPNLDGSLPWMAKWRRTTLGGMLGHSPVSAFNQLIGYAVRRFALGSPKARLARFGINSNFSRGGSSDIRESYPSIVACPKALDFDTNTPPETYYVDALLDEDEALPGFDWSNVPKGRKLIYAALGSQAWILKDNGKSIYQRILKAFGRRDDCFLIVAAGSLAAALREENQGENALILDWAPQREILKRAYLMVTHAGLGSVKECIHNEVPMICIPMGRDQPGTAARVQYHRLGVVGDVKKVIASDFGEFLSEIICNPIYRMRLKEMNREFAREANTGRLTQVIRDAISAPGILT